MILLWRGCTALLWSVPEPLAHISVASDGDNNISQWDSCFLRGSQITSHINCLWRCAEPIVLMENKGYYAISERKWLCRSLWKMSVSDACLPWIWTSLNFAAFPFFSSQTCSAWQHSGMYTMETLVAHVQLCSAHTQVLLLVLSVLPTLAMYFSRNFWQSHSHFL